MDDHGGGIGLSEEVTILVRWLRLRTGSKLAFVLRWMLMWTRGSPGSGAKYFDEDMAAQFGDSPVDLYIVDYTSCSTTRLMKVFLANKEKMGFASFNRFYLQVCDQLCPVKQSLAIACPRFTNFYVQFIRCKVMRTREVLRTPAD